LDALEEEKSNQIQYESSKTSPDAERIDTDCRGQAVEKGIIEKRVERLEIFMHRGIQKNMEVNS
jgi:hypothetical protein